MNPITASVRNGVDTEQVYGTLDALKAQPELARFVFRAPNTWIDGTYSRTTIQGFWGAGQEDASREEPFELAASEPPILFGRNEAPNPAEYRPARARRLPDADDRQHRRRPEGRAHRGQLRARGRPRRARRDRTRRRYRNGFERIDVRFSIKGDAPREKLEEIVERAKARSAVYDIVTNPVPVHLTAEVA